MLKFVIRYAQWIIAFFGFLVFGLTQTQWMTNSDLWQKTNFALIDRRYSNRPGKLPDPNIKLVGIVDSSVNLVGTLAPEDIAASPTLQLMTNSLPWDRKVWATVLEKLMNAGAKVVMFDFVFPGATPSDQTFANAIQKYKDHVVISGRFIEEANQYTQYQPPVDDLILPDVENAIGFANVWTDADGVIRRGKYRTSLENESGQFPPDYFPNNINSIDALAVEKFTGKTSLLPKAMASFIDYQGPAGTYAPLAVERMFVKRDWESPLFDNGMVFSNKIVIIGPVAEILHDLHTTPLNKFGDTPGAEIHAQITAALLENSWLTEPQPLVGLALALGLMWIALEICLRIKNALFKVLLLVASTAIFFIACQISFTHYKLVLPMTQPLFCLVVTGAFGIVFQYALEQVERLRYRNILGRYVSENVAKAVLDDKRSFEESLRGLKKPVTILFSDIRGFTTMTETRDADKLVAQLNEYFGEMVKIIEEENHGTLQKFIGDAIMAAWGDVYSYGVKVDATRAITAALQMRPTLAKLNAGWKDNADRQNLAIGIGVNHGEVIYGNIGSTKRMELTVIGDGVNLAARLESATKQFHADILVGETVEALTRDLFIFRPVDLLTVKGKSKPIEVFTLLSDRSQPAPAWLEKYLEAVKLYRNRKFAEAAGQFEAAQKEIGGEDFLCEMYVKRCKAYIEQPPPENWDGSYTLSEK